MIDARSKDVDPNDATPALILGLISLSALVERVVEQSAASGPVAPAQRDDPIALAVLGALSLARSLRAAAEGSAPPLPRVAPAVPFDEPSSRGSIRELLR